MAQATRKKTTSSFSLLSSLRRGTREVALIVFSAVAIYLMLSLTSYEPTDPGWSHTADVQHILNQGGIAGAWFADLFLYLFGLLAYLFPVMVGYAGWLVYKASEVPGGFNLQHVLSRSGGFVLTLGAGCGLATLHFKTSAEVPLDAGGILGNVVGNNLVHVFSARGGTLFLLALFLTGITLCTNLSWLSLIDTIGRYTLTLFRRSTVILEWMGKLRQVKKQKKMPEIAIGEQPVRSAKRKEPRIEPKIARTEPSIRSEKERQVPLFEPPAEGSLPPLTLLDEPPSTQSGQSKSALEAISRQVELKLRDFDIEVQVTAVHPGPVITRYELQLAPGVKVSRISNLAKDLARSLSTISVRIVEVIPGKSVIGLELPNEHKELVCLSEIIRSKQYDEKHSPLTLALGKDIGGHSVVADLARMPHLLVAGTTGSGKSVAINAMVLSLLYKASPQDVRMIMIDLKMVELSVYDGIPHLLAPVVTDTKEAANSLRWCVAEMERRYRLMSELGVRNMGGLNRKISEAVERGEPIVDPLHTNAEDPDPPYLEPLPFIVVIVDELADMMMTVGKKAEDLITRLAQKARASGIHLILATQRPSVDVITGLIKANIPIRVAFQVSSKVDSRTILDQGGAEQLLGHGDMLYLGPGMPIPTRVHGAFVSDQEVHRVVANLKSSGDPSYVDEVLKGGSEDDMLSDAAGSGDDDVEMDPLYDQAVRLVTESRRASISGVQRRLKIGYNRAARMIEQMELCGIVGPLQSNGSRDVLAGAPPED